MSSDVLTSGSDLPICLIERTVGFLTCYCRERQNTTTWQTMNERLKWTHDWLCHLVGLATIWYFIFYIVRDIRAKRRERERDAIESEEEVTHEDLVKEVDKIRDALLVKVNAFNLKN